MSDRKFNDEQIIQIIKEVEAGMSVKDACRQHPEYRDKN